VSSSGAQATGGVLGSGSFGLAISADGRAVAFASDATDLVPHDTNGTGCGKKLEDCGSDVFVRPR
jgi:hypothetical protein